MTIEAYLLNLYRYDFKDEKTGRQIKGVSVRFIIPSEDNDDSNNQIGASIQKMSLSFDKWENLRQQGLQTFNKVKLTFSGIGRSARLVDLQKADNDD